MSQRSVDPYFAGTVCATIMELTPWCPSPRCAADRRRNVLIVLPGDVGFSDLS
jgi:hypothetical protein